MQDVLEPDEFNTVLVAGELQSISAHEKLRSMGEKNIKRWEREKTHAFCVSQCVRDCVCQSLCVPQCVCLCEREKPFAYRRELLLRCAAFNSRRGVVRNCDCEICKGYRL